VLNFFEGGTWSAETASWNGEASKRLRQRESASTLGATRGLIIPFTPADIRFLETHLCLC
jgi:hypothetical protein